MRSFAFFFMVVVLVYACSKDTSVEDKINQQDEKLKLEARGVNWRAIGADVGGGLSGVSTGAWWGGLVGPTGAVLGGMLGGVIGCVSASVAAAIENHPNDTVFYTSIVPFPPSISSNNLLYDDSTQSFDYDKIAEIHNIILNESIMRDTMTYNELYDYIFARAVSELEDNGLDFTSLNLANFRTYFKATYDDIVDDVVNNAENTDADYIRSPQKQINST